MRSHRSIPTVLATLAVAASFLSPVGGLGGAPALEVTLHFGACDASAGVALGDRLFVVADDEDSWIRAYRRGHSGEPVWAMDLGPALEVDSKHPETDIEGAARVGNVVYWITSHACNQKARWRESRHRFFAMQIEGASESEVRLVPKGRPYRELVRDLAEHGPLRDLELMQASQLAPKEDGALNIEGLAASGEGWLWIGFRNPVPGGQAVLVQLLNPDGLLEGKRAKFGQVVRLPLAERGIRDMAWTGREWWLVAGSFDGKGKSRVYRWSGPGTQPERMRQVDLTDFNAEALLAAGGVGGDEVWLLSDDSSRAIGGVPCSELGDAAQRSFRSLRLR